MDDLISRSALLKCFSITKDGHKIPEKDCDNFEVTVSIKDIKRIIKNQPTAFNVDGVVEAIREYAECDDECAKTFYEGMGCKACMWNTMMDLVRKGGV